MPGDSDPADERDGEYPDERDGEYPDERSGDGPAEPDEPIDRDAAPATESTATDAVEPASSAGGTSRRRLLQLAGLTSAVGLAGCPLGDSDAADTPVATPSATPTPTETAEPGTETPTATDRPKETIPDVRLDSGSPRIMQVGEKLMDPIFTDAGHGFDRDNLAPRILEPERDPANYDASDCSWSVVDRPDGSEADIAYAPTPYDDGATQYDAGTHNTAEFSPDAPGRYVLELETPGDTFEQSIHAFPAEPSGAGGPPQLTLDGRVDEEAAEFVIAAEASLAPDSNAMPSDLEVVYLPDDSSSLSSGDLDVDDATYEARIPIAAVEDETSLYAAAFDGMTHSMTDEVSLDPAEPAVSLPNRPPEWLDDAVIYEIFTRSFASGPGETDFEFLAEKARYLGDLGVDVVWLTPIVPAWSASIEAETDKHAPGGPHGYSTGDYFDVADDLGTLEQFDAFVDACHREDIKVCFDFVINHCGWTNPKFQDTIASTGREFDNFWRFPEISGWNADSKYFDWFSRMEGATGLDAAPAQTSFFGVRLQPNLNYGNLALREHILAAADFWSERVDAFRCDIAWGVPHSFWKELREFVKAKDTEFMLLDETIPNDPSFAESEFDVHFDTKDFMGTVKEVAAGNAKAQDLITSIRKRTNEGFPPHTRVVNSTENHDESRLYVEVDEGGKRDNPAKAQRAAAAAGFTLPGVPFVYYGQERLISEHGHRRQSPFAGDPNRSDDIEQNPYSRGFMNWAEKGDTVPEDHLEFYRRLIEFYHDSLVMSADPDIVREWHQADSDDVLVFGLESGDEKRVVAVNFADEPQQVRLRSSVDTSDLFGGADVLESERADGTQTVTVDTLAVLETPSLLGLGERVIGLEEPAGDDHGPGSYTYPTSDAVAPGAFDVTAFEVHETPDTYQFVVEVDGPVENPWDLRHGFSVQHLQCYLRHPKGLWGDRSARAGVGIEFDDRYQYVVVADGANGARLETANGDRLGEGDVAVTPDGKLVVEFPKDPLLYNSSSLFVSPLMLGYDPEAPGNVMQVGADADERTFGGGSDPSHNVIDAVLPQEVAQSDALAPGENGASPPFTPLRTSFEEVASWSDPTGDDHGPGSYTYPTSDDFYDGAFDLTTVAAAESRERVRFSFELGTEIRNPWGLPRGFSHQFFQVYVRDENATESQPATTEGRFGTNLRFESPYHYRLAVNGEGHARVEKPDSEQKFGSIVTNDVGVEIEDGKIFHVDLPKGSIGGSLEGLELAFVVAPYDGFGTGGLRGIAASKSEYTIGGGSDDSIDPTVMDVITPEGVSQAEALAYDADNPATLPYVAFESGTE